MPFQAAYLWTASPRPTTASHASAPINCGKDANSETAEKPMVSPALYDSCLH